MQRQLPVNMAYASQGRETHKLNINALFHEWQSESTTASQYDIPRHMGRQINVFKGLANHSSVPFGDPRVAREASCYRETFRDPHDMREHWARRTMDPTITNPNNKPSTHGVGAGQVRVDGWMSGHVVLLLLLLLLVVVI